MGNRSFASTVGAIAVLLAVGQADAEVRSMTLDLGNSGDRALRCLMVIAHFMSDELGTIAPGERLAVAFQRDDADGSLFVRSNDGRRKMIENIVCGASDDWSQTRGDVPLLPLRSTHSPRALITCRLGPRLTCVVTDSED